jgi:hypothetical protein
MPECNGPIIVEQAHGGFFGPYEPKYLCPTKEQLLKYHELGREKGYRDFNGRPHYVEWTYTMEEDTLKN